MHGVESGNTQWVVASAPVRHKAPASDDGYTGIVIKQSTPAADQPRTERDLVKAGEGYVLFHRGVHPIPRAGLAAAVKGQLVYIADDTNALSLTSGTGKSVLGAVSALAGERGCAADQLRVDLGRKA